MKPIAFFQCESCPEVLISIAPARGCGLTPVTANTVDASLEKHVPVLAFEGDKLIVKVGAAAHPMIPEHYIEWVLVQTKDGGQYRTLTPGEAPEAVFPLSKEQVVDVYAYCNLHGLWKAALR